MYIHSCNKIKDKFSVKKIGNILKNLDRKLPDFKKNLYNKTNTEIGLPSKRYFDEEVKKYSYMWTERGEYSRE